MNKEEFDKALATIPTEEVGHFQKWYVAFQDTVEWEQFKSEGYRHVAEVVKDVEKHVTKVMGKPKQLKLAFMPMELARTSPFFP